MSLNSFLISLSPLQLHAIIKASPVWGYKDQHASLTIQEKNALFQALLNFNYPTKHPAPRRTTTPALPTLTDHKLHHAAPEVTQRPSLPPVVLAQVSSRVHTVKFPSKPSPRLRVPKLKTKPKAVLFLKEALTGERFISLSKMPAATIKQALADLGLSTNLKQLLSVDEQVLLALALQQPYMTPQTGTIMHDYSACTFQTRPPIVTIMGHVDHGKTSLLDYIRKTHLTAKEFGHITQKIGAYTAFYADQYLTFLDTPGHKAFAAIRARGSAVADIVVLVIDVTSGIQPQTIEAIHYIQAKQIPTVIALNKIDKDHPSLKQLYDALASQNMLIEAYGGDLPTVPTSPVAAIGMDDLLQSILALAEMLALKAAVDGPAEGYTLESRLDQRMGTRTTVVVTNGRLNIGDVILTGTGYGVVKALRDEFDRPVLHAGPAMPVDVIGLDTSSQLGMKFAVAPDVKTAKAAVEFYAQPASTSTEREPLITDITQLLQAVPLFKALHVSLKADSQGSLAALQQEIQTLTTSERKIKVKSTGIGSISPDDLEFAAVSQSVIIYFNAITNVGDLKTTLPTTKGLPITIVQSNIVYRLTEEIERIFVAQEKQESKEVLGAAEVVAVFQGIEQKIAGCKVTAGKLLVNTTVHVMREGKIWLTGKIQSLRHLKDSIKEARVGTECGLIMNGYKPLAGDKIEFYK